MTLQSLDEATFLSSANFEVVYHDVSVEKVAVVNIVRCRNRG